MPILDSHTIEFFSRSPEQTRRIGMRIGAGLKAGDVICLQGNLGAGKTTFVQGLAQGWGSLDSVSSPTFILVSQYRRANGDRRKHHLRVAALGLLRVRSLRRGCGRGRGRRLHGSGLRRRRRRRPSELAFVEHH
ncbi:MAG TPA: tRNA (adenosine(37)-N6)-threonylcarbamoyltransferase complex ATPase subunit type 1 TsaE, partial [Anaerolineales bacterium]|nr:tRNA (adenosine(37)-N6)-threonylcarbamoyltransferase complex ATPase subunit type 1 TsaE [Anaerolineales bacterium]